MTRDWDKELAKIDKRLEQVSDEALFPTSAGTTPGRRQEIVAQRKRTATLGALARLVLAVALAVGVMFWPYPHPCGASLAAYLAVVLAVVGAGVWSSVWTWRHRTARAHVLSLLIVLWGLVLGAREVVPRVGVPPGTPDAPTWVCR